MKQGQPQLAILRNEADRHRWYYPVFGLLAGADVVLFAYLSSDSFGAIGPMFLVAGFTGALIIPRITNTPMSAQQYRKMILWLVTVAVLFVGGLLLASIVAHQGGAVWLSWAIGVVVFAAYASGMKLVDGHPMRRSSLRS